MRVDHNADHTVDGPHSRFLLIHYHIFKNGGTTIESILRREFRRGFASLHGPADGSVLDARELTKFLRQHPKVRAVSSHHLRYPKPDARGWVIFDCCFLRHPLDRLVSVHNHVCRENPPGRQSLRDFVRRMLDEAPHLVSDVQVNQLANGGAFVRPANPADLDRASDLLSGMAVPGVMDLFDESLVSAEYFLRPAFPGLRLHYRPENVSRPHGQSSDGRSPADLWGADLHDDLLRLNQMDIELYRRARMEVLRRFLLVPQRAERLARFRARNTALNEPVTAAAAS